jgi:SAM-dependent methyltransferase
MGSVRALFHFLHLPVVSCLLCRLPIRPVGTNMRQPQEHDLTLSGVAGEVRDFYNRYPYPPPVDNLEKYRWLWQDPARRRADYHLLWPARPYTEDRPILIAGCGTSQAAKHALRWPEARIVGIDFSATSVRCTEHLKRKYNLRNLQVYQLPIEQAGDLNTKFDSIVCTGVLHHLADPDGGLRALRGVLKRDGAIHIMVYAPYGRTGIYMLQEFCKRIGISAGDLAIRDLIGTLMALPPGRPLEALLREAPDFRHEATLADADALLHPLDRAYSVPQFFDFIERGGLTFGRWVRQAPYTPRCGALANISLTSRMAQLPLPQQYAAVELFRGTMIRHSAVAYRNDNPDAAQSVSFDGDAWPGYVPNRMSDTICVDERLPAGAAAVLINRSHTYKDLFMPIDSTERSLLDAIDGNNSIGDIVKRHLPSSNKKSRRGVARAFFERLWLYDEVVFDGSEQTERHPAAR